MPNADVWGELKRSVQFAVQTDKHFYGGYLDRLAIDENGEIQLAVVVADSQAVKGLNAAIQKSGFGMRVIGSDLTRVVEGNARTMVTREKRFERSGAGYVRRNEGLGYGLSHSSWVSRSPSFLPVATHEGLWNALNHPQYTTPILRAWMPWIAGQLLKAKLLQPCWCYRCYSAVIVAKPVQVDDIVSRGVRTEKLVIE